jgi:hypothetical protein
MTVPDHVPAIGAGGRMFAVGEEPSRAGGTFCARAVPVNPVIAATAAAAVIRNTLLLIEAPSITRIAPHLHRQLGFIRAVQSAPYAKLSGFCTFGVGCPLKLEDWPRHRFLGTWGGHGR